MPIFSFLCQDCSFQFELLIGVTSTPSKLQCPKCKSKIIQKQFSTFAVKNKSESSPECLTDSCSTETCSSGLCPKYN